MPFDDTSRHIDFGEIRAVLIDRVELLAETLLGAHSKTHSNRTTRRWGSKGSLALVLSGSKRGAWRSHEAVEGGGPIELICHARRCSFSDAVEWGADWAGIAPADDIDQAQQQARDEQRRRDREQRQAQIEVEGAVDRRDRIARAQRLLRRTVPIDGTVAEQYLIKTRHIPRPAGGWPACLRFLPDRTVTLPVEGWPKLETAGAMVLVATLPDGTVTGGQRVYLTADAGNLRAAAGDKVKLSIGVLDGAAARLPGPAAGPLLLAEGPETALSVWAATGHETHAALGSLPNLRPSAGRRVVLCRDDDKAHSPADKALARWVEGRRKAGVDLVVVAPWATRREDKSDFNDLIREGGATAVRLRIAAVLDPGPPPPRRMPVITARREMDAAVGRFFDAAIAWGDTPEGIQGAKATTDTEAPPPDGEDSYGVNGIPEMSDVLVSEGATPAPPVQLVQTDTGTGKSHSARHHAARVLAELRAAGDRRNVVLAVPTHRLSDEQHVAFVELAAARGVQLAVEVWRGRWADDPEQPGRKMCRNPEAVREAQGLMLDVREYVCKLCPHQQECSYLAQQQKRADLWIVPHQILFERKPGAIGKPAMVVVDESPMPAALDGADSPATLPLSVLERVDRVVDDPSGMGTERLAFLRRLAHRTLVDLPDGPIARAPMIEAGLSAGAAAEAFRLEWQTRIEPDITPGVGPAERKAAMVAAQRNADLGRRASFWRALRALLAEDGPAASGWAALAPRKAEGGQPIRALALKGRREVRSAWRVPTLLLDATARIELLRPIWPDVAPVAEIRAVAPHQHIRQVTDRGFALSMLDVEGAKDGVEADHRRRNLRRVHAVICREARRFAPERTLLIVQERIERLLQDYRPHLAPAINPAYSVVVR